ncbi:MAG: hypothetical protein COV57_00185 [Candidatus Liptonbacteria bacterium CG11_big_fil_rev_8_21_14_0_20_35_14]|uniref:Uncharacterized protein n=1 Tax=Candidatus Liptonbacteria bacterium CG11_big_fil_rev_8_21_14_0_20_35_14 TaxID=1974634 RepID=A0A2H0N8P7_9BACT|nr:MAG: hypothetical protein COV57_00185 [Candidatus Liptonbacteria bacterium CG11_big_fil_rev_8_21_14_0_20_35_14]
MTKKSHQKSIINKVVSKRVLDQKTVAFKTYDTYKKTADIIERAEFAFGKRAIFKSDTGSTLNFEINRYGAYSTTAQ